MLKVLPIEFVRQALEQTLLEEHIKNVNYFGGKDQMSLVSFYEQLKTQQEIDRFVDTIRDLNDQQNRTGLIGNGVLLSPENPTITNLYSSLIIPFTWTCSIRTTLGNRDAMVETLQNLIEKLKGRKCDMAQLVCKDLEDKTVPSLFKVGTLGQGGSYPAIKSGDFIGSKSYNQNTDTRVKALISTNTSKGLTNSTQLGDYLYIVNVGAYGLTNIIQPAKYVEEENEESFSFDYFDVEDVYYDEMQPGIRSVNGNIHIESYEQFTSIPNDISSFKCNFVFYDTRTQTYKTYKETLTFNRELLSLDASGHIVGRIFFDFEVKEEDVDFDNASYLAEVENISDPTYTVIEQVWKTVANDGTNNDVVFPDEHTNFEKYKLSLSFDSFRIDEPRNLNAEEYCEISFGGSATLVSDNVFLGNDLVKLGVQKNKILAETPITFSGATTYYLEPLELPSGLNANTQINQLLSNNFKQNTHTDGTAGLLQYSFIMDKSFDILKQWFDYARFGDYGITANKISPNMIYNVTEFWSSWGNVEKHTMLCKITESIDIENTESDVLTLGVNFQIQGENN